MKKHVIIDSRTPEKICDRLRGLEYEIISLPPCPSLPNATSAHPDMLIFFGDKCFVCAEEYTKIADEALKKIELLGYSRIVTSEALGTEYPKDILFNALLIRGKIYCKDGAVSKEIIKYAEAHGLALRHVKQGYAKCSVCPVGNNAAITADPSLAYALSADAIDVLKISPGGILLPPYDTGFIGGCSGVDQDTVYFSGNIDLHPDGDMIKNFCAKHQKKVVSLSSSQLSDVGTMFFI